MYALTFLYHRIKLLIYVLKKGFLLLFCAFSVDDIKRLLSAPQQTALHSLPMTRVATLFHIKVRPPVCGWF